MEGRGRQTVLGVQGFLQVGGGTHGGIPMASPMVSWKQDE